MKVRFWGVRGSIATPGAGTLRFGGNTSCTQVTTDGGTLIIFDCGTGMRLLGQHLVEQGKPVKAHILLSHTHWDHIQGWPFFTPAFMPGNEFTIYAAENENKRLGEVLSGQMDYTYFPVTLDQMQSTIGFRELRESSFTVEEAKLRLAYLNHTCLVLGYRVEVDGASLVYATDTEPYVSYRASHDSARRVKPLAPETFVHEGDRRLARFAQNADALIIDAQYTEQEYLAKKGWGHSSVEYATDIAIAAGVKQLLLYHHDPTHTDEIVDEVVKQARQRVAEVGSPLKVCGAAEGLELQVGKPVLVSPSPAT